VGVRDAARSPSTQRIAVMSIVSFIQDAGEKLFKHGGGTPAPHPSASASATPPSAPAQSVDALNRSASDAIRGYLASKGLASDGLRVDYDGATTTVTVSGSVPDQETREKIVLLAGNVANVHHVNDQLSVAGGGSGGSGAESEYYEVKEGDTLSKIAQQRYGSAGKYSAIFEANKPMLSDPDKIYPGQKLRIPRLS
jgi:nucleoid-associated protein YgaU